ncbi:trypsin-like serine protease [Actinoplanes sp. NPDC051859]|uniref:trypsin-like serine protease n=1 Tax=Actinoplanes sp. NPDC051859 TaxID=3363909 RepID=UPI0037BB2C5B
MAVAAASFLGGSTAQALIGETSTNGYSFTARVNVGAPGFGKGCTGALVATGWVLTARSCVDTPDKPATIGMPATPITVNTGLSSTVNLVIPHPSQNVAMLRLTPPAGTQALPVVTPIPLATTAPTAGQTLRLIGYGRTADTWVPDAKHTGTVTVNTMGADTLKVTGTNPSGVTTCKGDAGGPAIREISGRVELVGLHVDSSQYGCLGAPVTSDRSATELRTDTLVSWVQGNITNSTVGSPSPHGPAYSRTRSAGGAWDANPTLVDNNLAIKATAAATLSDGSLHVFNMVVNSGIWYRSRSASGVWSGATKIDANVNITDIAATGLPNGTVNLQTLVPNSGVWNKIRKADGVWEGATKIDDNVAITDIASAGLKNGTLQVQTLVGGSGVWSRSRTTGNVWGASSKIDSTTTISAIATAALPDGSIQFLTLVPGSGAGTGIWTRSRSAAGVWSTAKTQIDTNGGIDELSAAGLPNGTVQVTGVVLGSGLWIRNRSTAGTWETSATRIDTNGKVFDSYTAALANGTVQVGTLTNIA